MSNSLINPLIYGAFHLWKPSAGHSNGLTEMKSTRGQRGMSANSLVTNNAVTSGNGGGGGSGRGRRITMRSDTEEFIRRRTSSNANSNGRIVVVSTAPEITVNESTTSVAAAPNKDKDIEEPVVVVVIPKEDILVEPSQALLSHKDSVEAMKA